MNDIKPEDARQGGKGKQVRNILFVSLILVAIVWFAVSIYGAYISKDENTINSNNTQSESTPLSNPTN
ncbi:hypothetical protein [Pseudochrobactrum sp. MP213Fo]|uniref:hypothetical protein n=1 Tax=Pseudochrobactrum sp. MP213Fo TaxID=3022250 RepID=UPI003BA3D44B